MVILGKSPIRLWDYLSKWLRGEKFPTKGGEPDFWSAYPPLSWFQKNIYGSNDPPTSNHWEWFKTKKHLPPFLPQKKHHVLFNHFVRLFFFPPSKCQSKKRHESEELQSLCNPSEDRKLGKSFPERMRRGRDPSRSPSVQGMPWPAGFEKKPPKLEGSRWGADLIGERRVHGTKLELGGVI